MKGMVRKMDITATSCEKQNKLSELISKIQSIAVSVNESSNRLDSLTDRFIGACPEVAGDSEATQPRQGIIGELEDVVGTLNMRSTQISDSVNRLVNSGMV